MNDDEPVFTISGFAGYGGLGGAPAKAKEQEPEPEPERVGFLGVDEERTPVVLCRDCRKHVATIVRDNGGPWEPSYCADCRIACGDCCGYFEHDSDEQLRAEAKRLGWPETRR